MDVFKDLGIFFFDDFDDGQNGAKAEVVAHSIKKPFLLGKINNKNSANYRIQKEFKYEACPSGIGKKSEGVFNQLEFGNCQAN